jgi:hypothetical protein
MASVHRTKLATVLVSNVISHNSNSKSPGDVLGNTFFFRFRQLSHLPMGTPTIFEHVLPRIRAKTMAGTEKARDD